MYLYAMVNSITNSQCSSPLPVDYPKALTPSATLQIHMWPNACKTGLLPSAPRDLRFPHMRLKKCFAFGKGIQTPIRVPVTPIT